MITVFMTSAFLVPVTLLPILNPFGNAPVFSSIVGTANPRLERRIAWLVALNCWFMLLGAIFIGSHVLAFFGISLPIVRLGGGLLVAATGWRRLHDNGHDAIQSQVARVCDDGLSDDELRVKSFYPISFPLTVGPGSIAAAITIGASTPARLLDWVIALGSSAVGVTVTVTVIYVCYRYASKFVTILGRLGTTILLRLSAFVLFCIGLNIAWIGVLGMLREAGLYTL